MTTKVSRDSADRPARSRGRRLRIPSSVLLAFAIAAAAGAWIASGQFGAATAPPTSEAAAPAVAEPEPLMTVRVRTQSARLKTSVIVVRGQTEASRTVDLRGETAGRVEEIVVPYGARVRTGDVILRLALDDREANLRQAQALVAQRLAEYQASEQLARQGHRSATQLAEALANLEAARAVLAGIEIDIAHTEIRAPFDGVVESRYLEVGDFIDVGDAAAKVVDLDPALVIGYVSERDIGALRMGGSGSARLVTGLEVEGTIRFISSIADPATRTFRIELEIPNPEGRVMGGLTTDVVLPVGEVRAHPISPAVLTLGDEGQIGIKVVDADDVVVFYPVDIVDDTPEGIWLAGLPETVRIITVGQEFVRTGQRVAPQEETPAAAVSEVGS